MVGGGVDFRSFAIPMRQRGRPSEAHPQRCIPGWGGFPLIGTPTIIVDTLLALSEAGIAGCLLSWVDYEREQQQWIDEVLPLMEQAGLRDPFDAASRVLSSAL
jgi:alkanesulfonate monooxygenase SsuD/methylene tetrahydromethanopterin reductase-like flavin-dependent oxidoreductase (luciferase family)